MRSLPHVSATMSSPLGDIVLHAMQTFRFDGQLSGVCVDVVGNRILVANSSVADHLEVLRPASVRAAGAVYASLVGVGEGEGDDVQRPWEQRDGRHLLPARCVLPSAPLLPKADVASDQLSTVSSDSRKSLSDLSRVHITHTDATDVAEDSGTAAVAALDFSHVPKASTEPLPPPRFPDVYPPSMPDTHLFLDVLASDAPALAKRRPTLCIEVGCGAAPLADARSAWR